VETTEGCRARTRQFKLNAFWPFTKYSLEITRFYVISAAK